MARSEDPVGLDDPHLELKIHRSVANNGRFNAGVLYGMSVLLALGQGLRVLYGKPVHEFLIMFAVALFALGVVMPRLFDSAMERSIRTRTKSKRNKVLDRPMRTPKLFLGVSLGLMLYLIIVLAAIGDWGPLSTPAMSSYFAGGLIWGGLRWRRGEQIGCRDCGYAWSEDGEELCPECGSRWNAHDGLAIGEERVVLWMVIGGFGLVALDITAFVLSS